MEVEEVGVGVHICIYMSTYVPRYVSLCRYIVRDVCDVPTYMYVRMI